MKFESPPQSGFPKESLCDVIELGIPFERNLELLRRKFNLSEHKPSPLHLITFREGDSL